MPRNESRPPRHGPRTSALDRQAEQRLCTSLESLPQLMWRSTDDGNWVWASAQWSAFTGLSSGQSLAMGWLDGLNPDDRDKASIACRSAAQDGDLAFEARIREQPDGGYRWFQIRAKPVRDPGGGAVEWIGSASDVHELHLLRMRQRQLAADLQHRVRNMLTVIRSVFARTVEIGEDLAAAADHFSGRLDALARAQMIVARGVDRQADLENLLRDELLSVGVSHSPSIHISGPDVMLADNAVELLCLAFHELTTNALKFGALKTGDAKLDIHWLVNLDDKSSPLLDLTWRERGVPAVSIRPEKKGFGRELIVEVLPYRLGGAARLDFLGGGVCCHITVPLPVQDVGNTASPDCP